jgi:dihydrodipicolinate synthase/N-acetylneuraminate lyase
MTAGEWKGVIVAMITPLKDNGSRIDLDALDQYCDFLSSKGVHGVFCSGTTGEGPLLSLNERKMVAERVVERLKGKTRVIVHTGSITTADTIDLTRHACKIGADAAGVVLPYYYGYNDALLFEYFSAISDSIPGYPLFIYNIPQCTTNNLSLTLFEKLLVRIESIVGVKNSNPDIFQTIGFVKIAQGRCSVFLGCDSLILAGLSVGVRGVVSGNASAYPEPFVRIFAAHERDDLEEMREVQRFIDRLIGVLAQGRDIASFKKALNLRGIPAGSVRGPDRDLSEEESKTLREGLSGLGLLEHPEGR